MGDYALVAKTVDCEVWERYADEEALVSLLDITDMIASSVWRSLAEEYAAEQARKTRRLKDR